MMEGYILANVRAALKAARQLNPTERRAVISRVQAMVRREGVRLNQMPPTLSVQVGVPCGATASEESSEVQTEPSPPAVVVAVATPLQPADEPVVEPWLEELEEAYQAVVAILGAESGELDG
jgi:hypothetical protein